MSVTDSAQHEELNRLLMRTAHNDRRAFSQLYERTCAKLFGICTRVLPDRREAEEVLQDAYVTVWQRAASFDARKARALTWLITLTRNKAIDRLRQHHDVLTDHGANLDALVDEQPSPALRAERGQEYQRLQECLDTLEPQQRHAVREAFFSGATYNELAARAQVPLGTMKSWIRRSLLQLRACLNT